MILTLFILLYKHKCAINIKKENLFNDILTEYEKDDKFELQTKIKRFQIKERYIL